MNLSTVVLLGLAIVWAIVLAPEVLRWTAGFRRVDPMQSFHRQMSSLDRRGVARPASRPGSNVIDLRGPSPSAGGRAAARQAARPLERGAGRPAGRTTGRPAPRSHISPRVQKRRQDVLVLLVAVAVLSLLCAVAFGGLFLAVHLVADVLLVGYVLLLNRAAQAPARARRFTSPMSPTVDLRMTRPAPVNSRRVAN